VPLRARQARELPVEIEGLEGREVFVKVRVLGHKPDVVPGLANRVLVRIADTITISFKEARKYFPTNSPVLVGNPVRRKFAEISKREAKKILGLESRRQVIFVIGGSQGARSVNQLVALVAPRLLKKYALVASTGATNNNDFEAVKNQKVAVIKPFMNEEELAAAYTLADVVVTRAGAGVIFEVASYGKPAILLPLESSAGGHQLQNALSYEASGSAVVLRDKNVNEQVLALSIETILQEEDNRNFMAESAKKFARPNAAKKLANIVLNKASDKRWSKFTRKVG